MARAPVKVDANTKDVDDCHICTDNLHPDQLPFARQMWDHVAPQIRRRLIAVQEHNRIAGALFGIGHLFAMSGGKTSFCCGRM